MELDPTQARELEFLRSQRSMRPVSGFMALAIVTCMSLVAGGAAAFVAAQQHQPWIPWLLAGAAGGLLISALVLFLQFSMTDEKFIRWTVPSDKAARDGGRAIQRDGIRNRPPGEPPTPKYWDAWK